MKQDTRLGDPERKYLAPHLRRALFEKKMLDAALDSGLRAEVARVSSGAAQYNMVRCGRLVVTCSRTQSSSSVPRNSAFREQYSLISNHLLQGQLFVVPSTPTENSLYCVLVHGPSAEKESDVGFLSIGFPDAKAEGWVEAPIDLIDLQEYQRQRFQKAEQDARAEMQVREPVLKPEFRKGDADDTERSA